MENKGVNNFKFFEINGISFEIESTKIEGKINENCQIEIFLDIKMKEQMINGKVVAPQLCITNGIKMYIDSINNLDNVKFSYNVRMGDKEGWKLYNWESENIESGKLFLSHKGNGIFSVNWSGKIESSSEDFKCTCDAQFDNWQQLQEDLKKAMNSIANSVKNEKYSTLIIRLRELRNVLSFNKYNYEKLGDIIAKLNSDEINTDKETMDYIRDFLSSKNLFNPRWVYDYYGTTVNGLGWASYISKVEKICEKELCEKGEEK